MNNSLSPTYLDMCFVGDELEKKRITRREEDKKIKIVPRSS
jgi:hypothetical protein